MSMVCQICKVRAAKVHYTEIVNNNMVTLNLCTQCAEEKGIDVQQAGAGSYGLGDLVAGLIDTTVDIESEKIGKVRCPSCGYEYSDFKKIGRFGCPDCYDAFEAQLLPMLRQIHGNTHHAGSKPEAAKTAKAAKPTRISRLRRVGELRESLARAVEAEDYERAADIRDEIKQLEVEIASGEPTDVEPGRGEG